MILSETIEGAQTAMNKLGAWCDKWALDVNISKTKLMSTCPINGLTIQFKGANIESVSVYRYLGVELNKENQSLPSQVDLTKRASKVYFKAVMSIENNRDNWERKKVFKLTSL